jgi:hypothetical protein
MPSPFLNGSDGTTSNVWIGALQENQGPRDPKIIFWPIINGFPISVKNLRPPDNQPVRDSADASDHGPLRSHGGVNVRTWAGLGTVGPHSPMTRPYWLGPNTHSWTAATVEVVTKLGNLNLNAGPEAAAAAGAGPPDGRGAGLRELSCGSGSGGWPALSLVTAGYDRLKARQAAAGAGKWGRVTGSRPLASDDDSQACRQCQSDSEARSLAASSSSS